MLIVFKNLVDSYLDKEKKYMFISLQSTEFGKITGLIERENFKNEKYEIIWPILIKVIDRKPELSLALGNPYIIKAIEQLVLKEKTKEEISYDLFIRKVNKYFNPVIRIHNPIIVEFDPGVIFQYEQHLLELNEFDFMSVASVDLEEEAVKYYKNIVASVLNSIYDGLKQALIRQEPERQKDLKIDSNRVISLKEEKN